MPESLDEIAAMAGPVVHHATTVQLDLMDGKYVPETTWPFVRGGEAELTHLLSEDESLPFWDDLDYEIDLMIERPEQDLDTWLHLGAARIVFHYASVKDWDGIRAIDAVTRNFTNIGCAVTVHDNLDDVCTLIEEGIFDFIQIMGIAHIGYQGEPFEERCLGIIATLKNQFPHILISVDGGVSLDTISKLYDAGVDRFVSGSGVYGGGIIEENIHDLVAEIA